MAQESWNEIDETEIQKPESPILCANNCGFFGSPMTNNLCSKCFRDLVMNQNVLEIANQPTVSSSSLLIHSVPDQSDKFSAGNIDHKSSEKTLNKQDQNRCSSCRRKVGLTGFKCRCGSTFCSAHRYPELHECSFDYKCAGREAIAKENPLVKAEKIEKI